MEDAYDRTSDIIESGKMGEDIGQRILRVKKNNNNKFCKLNSGRVKYQKLEIEYANSNFPLFRIK